MATTNPPGGGGGTIPGVTPGQIDSVDDALFIPVRIDIPLSGHEDRWSVKVTVRGPGGAAVIGAGVVVVVSGGTGSSGVTGVGGIITLGGNFDRASSSLTVQVSGYGFYSESVTPTFVELSNGVYRYEASVALERNPIGSNADDLPPIDPFGFGPPTYKRIGVPPAERR